MKYSQPDCSLDNLCINDKGLNCQAIFNIKSLPADVIENLENNAVGLSNYTQLILIAHRGPSLWQYVAAEAVKSSHPVDDYSVSVLTECFQQLKLDNQFEFIYPSDKAVDLQRLGELAGWHYTSPLNIGVNAHWGGWFAYRAVVLAKSNFEPTNAMKSYSPCIECQDKACINSCPSQAVNNQGFKIQNCVEYRLTPDSQCKDKCLSRLSCPVAKELQYSDEQMRYHYGISLETIKKYYS